jgi:hypothetical protein
MSDTVFFHRAKQEFFPVGTKFEHIDNISKYEDGSLSSIVIQDLLDFYPEEEMENVLLQIISKLSRGGTLDIQSIDMKMLGVAIAFNDINAELTKQVLYPFKRSIHTMSEIADICTKNGMDIIMKKYVNIFEYYISSTKK